MVQSCRGSEALINVRPTSILGSMMIWVCMMNLNIDIAICVHMHLTYINLQTQLTKVYE